jgi:hypothetical protein
MKSAMYIVCGIIWLVFGFAAGFLFLAYIAETSGFYSEDAGLLSFLQPFSLETGVIQLIHMAGLFLITAFCFLVGVGLCSHGFAVRGEGAAEDAERSQAS